MLELDHTAGWFVRGQDLAALAAFSTGPGSVYYSAKGRNPFAESFWTEKFPRPEVAIFLDLGLGAPVKKFDKGVKVVPFTSLWPWADKLLDGHDKMVVVGKLNGVQTIAFAGSLYLYEGYSAQQVVQPVLLAHALGVKKVLLTNAADCIREEWQTGDLMVITDHLNFTGHDPLIGENNDKIGQRFPSMRNVYSLQGLLLEAANQAEIYAVEEGVYTAVTGPDYETPAYIRYLRNAGSCAVGKSTVLEAMVARWCGMEVGGVSLLTNMAAGINVGEEPNQKKVAEASSQAEERFTELVLKFMSFCKPPKQAKKPKSK